MGNTFNPKCTFPERTCDSLRDTPLRYLGYATHLGDICCRIIPPHLSSVPNMLTTAYVTSDIFSKATDSSNAFKPRSRVAIDTFDAIIWQMLASVIIPGLIMTQVKKFAFKATQPSTDPCVPHPPLAKALPRSVVRFLPCMIGILAIPLIKYPVDYGVTKLMDFTYRSILKEEEKVDPKKAAAKPPAKPPAKAPPKPPAKEPVKEKKPSKAENPK